MRKSGIGWFIGVGLVAMFFTSCSFMVKEKKTSTPLPADYFSKGKELEMASAIYNNNLDSVRLLIQEGVDINKLSGGGMTYLYFALMRKEYDIMKLLLENGANPNIANNFYSKPGYQKEGYSEEKELGVCLETSGDPYYEIKYMKLLIEYGANVNDTIGITPLEASCHDNSQSKEKIKYLVEHGADINYCISGVSIIGNQASIYNWGMVLFLLNLGANPMSDIDPDFNVASAVQDYYDEGFDLDSENGKMAQEVKRRLEQRGIKFPYHPKSQATSPESRK